MDRVRGLVLDLWAKTRRDWGFTSGRIAEVFRRERGLSDLERRRVAEDLQLLIRESGRVEFALQTAGARLREGSRDLAVWAAAMLLSGRIGIEAAKSLLPDVRWEAVASVDSRIAAGGDAAVRLARAHSLPEWLARRLLDEHGAQAEALAAALNSPAPVTLRANSLRTTRAELIDRLAAREIRSRAGLFARDAVVLEDRADVFALPEFRAGLFEMQDEGSQLVAELVAPPPGSLVVDACAGAGGKTLALSALLRGKGSVIATDVSPAKVIELRRRARRAGAANVRALVGSAQVRPPELARLSAKVRRVLVDAPCSGIGALRRNPEARWRLAADDVLRLAGLQAEIAAASLDLLAPGGRLIYATCTCLRAENQDVVAALLARGPDLELVPVGEILGGELARKVADPSGSFLMLAPDRHGTDGFFAAVLRRRRRP